MRISLAHEPEATAMMSGPASQEARSQPVRRCELLDHARRMRINISETLERRLRSLVRTELEKQWLQKSGSDRAVQSPVAEHGLLSDDCRAAVAGDETVRPLANPFPRNRERQPYSVALQSDLLSRSLDTVVVAPLETADSGKYADRLNPRVNVEEKAFTLIAQEIVTVRKERAGRIMRFARSRARPYHRRARSAVHRLLSRPFQLFPMVSFRPAAARLCQKNLRLPR